MLPLFVSADCLEDNKALSRVTCADVVCCGGNKSQCNEETHYLVTAQGDGSYKVATCVPKGTTEAGTQCLNKGQYPDKTCSQILCCEGLKCSETKSSGGTVTISSAECVTDDKASPAEVSQPPTVFTPSVTIPGTIFTAGKEIQVNGETLAQYISGFYKFFVGFMAVAAVVMIMWGGFKRIMAAGSAENVKNANGTIFAAIIGLVITLISYTLLNLINPSLVSFQPLTITPIKKESINFIGSADYEALTGSKPMKAFSPEMMAKMHQTASANGIDYCVIWTIFQKESGGRVDAIGYDENVNTEIASKVPSRVHFVETDKCKQFVSKKNANDCQLRGAARNDDSTKNLDVNKGDLAMDWRYSRGFGVGQITIFPSWHSNYRSCNGTPCVNIGGKDYLPKDLFNLDTNLEALVGLWKSKCGNGVDVDCFKKYNGSTEYSVDAMKVYNFCKVNNPG